MDYLTRKITDRLTARQGHLLTDAETRFVIAASRDQNRQTASCDVDRMQVLLRLEPCILKTVGPAALHNAIQFRGTEDAVRFLLDRGVRSFDLDLGLEYPLNATLRNDNIESLRLILEAGVGDASTVTEQANSDGLANVSLLYWVANLGLDTAYVELLLKHGADPELPLIGNGERGTTVLQEAVAHPLASDGTPTPDPVWAWRKLEVARAIVEQGARYDIYSAAGLDDCDHVRRLVAKDRDAAHRPSDGGMTPLHWAARNNAMRCATWLLKRDVDANTLNLAQRTAIHLAAEWNHTDMLWLLAAAGVDIDVPDANGRTPLHRATFLGRVEAAEILILLDADTEACDLSGRTPFDIARQGCAFLQGA
jgi:ankyrin repeat protein